MKYLLENVVQCCGVCNIDIVEIDSLPGQFFNAFQTGRFIAIHFVLQKFELSRKKMTSIERIELDLCVGYRADGIRSHRTRSEIQPRPQNFLSSMSSEKFPIFSTINAMNYCLIDWRFGIITNVLTWILIQRCQIVDHHNVNAVFQELDHWMCADVATSTGHQNENGLDVILYRRKK